MQNKNWETDSQWSSKLSYFFNGNVKWNEMQNEIII